MIPFALAKMFGPLNVFIYIWRRNKKMLHVFIYTGYVFICKLTLEQKEWLFSNKTTLVKNPILWWLLQLTLVISTSLISNNRLSRSENLVPAWTWRSNNRSNFSSFPQYFQIISNFKSQITYIFVKCGCSNYYSLNSANMIYRGTDISNYFSESLGIRDNESRLYFIMTDFAQW